MLEREMIVFRGVGVYFFMDLLVLVILWGLVVLVRMED